MTILVIHGTLLRIGKHLVGFIGFLELVFRILVIGIAVGMELHRHTTVGFFQVSLGDALFHTALS